MNVTHEQEKVRLYGFCETPETPVLAALFGEMVKRATPVTEHYSSDLFHDAEWLRENVTGPMWFYWVARTSGTDIGDMAALRLRDPGLLATGDVVYRVTLERRRLGCWWAGFEVVTP